MFWQAAMLLTWAQVVAACWQEAMAVEDRWLAEIDAAVPPRRGFVISASWIEMIVSAGVAASGDAIQAQVFWQALRIGSDRACTACWPHAGTLNIASRRRTH